MAEYGQTSLPYDMGNAGDLLKHGVMAEFLRASLIFRPAQPIRFLDLFGGEPYCDGVCEEIVERVNGLSGCALNEAQTDIRDGLYYGSGMLARKLGDRFGDRLSVVASDGDEGRRKRLRDSGLKMLGDEFPELAALDAYDGYAALDVIQHETSRKDLILIDPYAEFLKPCQNGQNRAESVIPIMEKMAQCSAVLLFALNLNPFNRVGRRFDALQRANLSGAYIMTCPPIRQSGIKGESKYFADVILAAPGAFRNESETVYFRSRLEALAGKLACTLKLSERGYAMLRPRFIGNLYTNLAKRGEAAAAYREADREAFGELSNDGKEH